MQEGIGNPGLGIFAEATSYPSDSTSLDKGIVEINGIEGAVGEKAGVADIDLPVQHAHTSVSTTLCLVFFYICWTILICLHFVLKAGQLEIYSRCY